MISLMEKQEIILSHFREGKSQWQIHRETGISRKTIRKYIKEYEKKKRELLNSNKDDKKLIEDIVTQPKYDSSGRVRRKFTDIIIERIEYFLSENEIKKATGRSKQQKKKIDIYECLIEEGYDISYSTVCNYIREKGLESKEAYIRQEYNLGQTCEFDWGYVKLIINGKPKTFQMAVFTSAKGNYRYASFYHNQKMENFLDAHVKFFNEIGGVYQEVVYDNMKVAVKRFVSKTDKEPTEDLLKLSLYYGFKYRFCNTRRGNEKGHVERSVEYVRRKVFSKQDEFSSIDEANDYLKEMLIGLNLRKTKYLGDKSPKDIINEEKPHLIELMPSYDTSRTCELRVNKYSVVSIDENKYSVPDNLVGKFVFAKIYPQEIMIYHKNKLVAKHKRSYSSHTWTIKIEHYINTIKKKPGSLHSSTAMRQMNPTLHTIYNNHYTENPKDFVDLLGLISEKSLEKVLEAIKELEKISPTGVNTEKVKMLCSRNKVENDIKNRIRNAKFPYKRYIEDLVIEDLPEDARKKVKVFSSLEFIETGQNIILAGNPGTGKTHMAIGLGIKACNAGYKVLFTTIPLLVNQLKESRSEKTLRSFEKRFEKYDLIIADELGYISFDKEALELLFTYLSLRAGRKSTIITTNLSFERWDEIFKDPVMTAAMIDRLTHKSYIVNMNGNSYRLKETKLWLENQ